MDTAYEFGPFRLDISAEILFRGADPMSVGRRAVAVLRALLERPGVPVSKDALMQAAWPGLAVEEGNLTVQIAALRRVLGEEPGADRWIETLPRRGYRFVGPIGISAQRPELEATLSFPEKPSTGALKTGPVTRAERLAASPPAPLSIVVLPFTNLSGDPEQDYFVDGVTESLTTDLSRISGSFVIARNTAFTFKGKAVDVKQIGRELNIRYALEGSIQRGGKQLRVNVQLVDVQTANHLWAERFDKPVADLFQMQDEIVARLVNALDAELIAVEARRAERSSHADTMDLYFRGMACLHKGLTREHLVQARGFFERALALDAQDVRALVGMGSVDLTMGIDLISEDRAASCSAAEATLSKALSLASGYAKAHMLLGTLHIFTARAPQGIIECKQALSLDRNLADAYGWIGLAKYFLGRAEETEAHIHEALRLSPRDILAYRWMMIAGIAKIQLNEDAEAVAWLRRSIEANRNFPLAHFHLAAALALVGSRDEARAVAQVGLSLDPGFTIRRVSNGAIAASNNPTFLAKRERFYEGMRLAGVPEG